MRWVCVGATAVAALPSSLSVALTHTTMSTSENRCHHNALLSFVFLSCWEWIGWNDGTQQPPPTPLPIHSAMKGEKGERQADCRPLPGCQMQKGLWRGLSTLFRSPFSACTKARLLGPYGLVQWHSRASLHQIFIKINNPRQLLRRRGKLCSNSAAGCRGWHT